MSGKNYRNIRCVICKSFWNRQFARDRLLLTHCKQ